MYRLLLTVTAFLLTSASHAVLLPATPRYVFLLQPLKPPWKAEDMQHLRHISLTKKKGVFRHMLQTKSLLERGATNGDQFTTQRFPHHIYFLLESNVSTFGLCAWVYNQESMNSVA